MEYQPLGSTFNWVVTTEVNGVATAATGTPTFYVNKNGVDGSPINMTQISTYKWRISHAFTTGNGYANGDDIAIVTSCVISGQAYAEQTLCNFKIGSELRNVSMQDLSAAPSATANAEDALAFIYQDMRNKKRQSSDTQTTYKDDGSTTAWTRTVDATTSATTIGEAS